MAPRSSFVTARAVSRVEDGDDTCDVYRSDYHRGLL